VKASPRHTVKARGSQTREGIGCGSGLNPSACTTDLRLDQSPEGGAHQPGSEGATLREGKRANDKRARDGESRRGWAEGKTPEEKPRTWQRDETSP